MDFIICCLILISSEHIDTAILIFVIILDKLTKWIGHIIWLIRKKVILRSVCSNNLNLSIFTVCPRSNYPFYTVIYYMKWITTSWIYRMQIFLRHTACIFSSLLFTPPLHQKYNSFHIAKAKNVSPMVIFIRWLLCWACALVKINREYK